MAKAEDQITPAAAAIRAQDAARSALRLAHLGAETEEARNSSLYDLFSLLFSSRLPGTAFKLGDLCKEA